MWRQDQHEVPLSVDSHDQRLARVRQQLILEGVGRQCQGMDREVRAAESLFGEFGPTGWGCPRVLLCRQPLDPFWFKGGGVRVFALY